MSVLLLERGDKTPGHKNYIEQENKLRCSLLGVWTSSGVLQTTDVLLLVQAKLQIVHLLQDENQCNQGLLPGLVILSRLRIAVDLGQY